MAEKLTSLGSSSNLDCKNVALGVLCVIHAELTALVPFDCFPYIKAGLCMYDGDECWVSEDTLDNNTVQLMRRRALHLLDLIVNNANNNANLNQSWTHYVACFQSLENEFQTHLVEQVWGLVASLSLQCSTDPTIMGFDWIGALVARALFSDNPTVRKLSLYRFMSNGVGISNDYVPPPLPPPPLPPPQTTHQGQKKPKTKKAKNQVSERAKRVTGDLVISPFFC